ncbi:uncharacterized protein GGS25DRAFT_35348 [Hypoxylon fragiforme]|uniref:uncharacterized protein n=1 Tax=Hypoxylon fragiforme TaxID=63214 RepID=UPI0020C5D1CB|nr:uncharacterized protein GGS25DRAFT_35348 [Hypoxylon fragiforme]KAI2614130.1 hypothetical protein GGS25DRAFT_35348 [Hypoxylon fragiforme]
MAPFAVPVPAYRLGIPQHIIGGSGARTKRQKTIDELDSPEPEWDTRSLASSSQPPGSINPLSHSPDTLRQLAVAGLAPEDELPSKAFPLFPHKRLPLGLRRRPRLRGETVDDDDDDDDGDGNGNGNGGKSEGEGKGYDDDGLGGPVAARQHKDPTSMRFADRMRHLSTLTAIMHRCLGEGDIARAKRAFGLLVRTRDVDVRQGGLWAVGSEILMRDGETNRCRRQQSQATVVGNNDGEEQQQQQQQQPEEEEEEEEQAEGREEVPPRPRRWGSPANIDKVRLYLESLIHQHPHDPHRPHLTSALDFWPALFAIELYNLDAEFRHAVAQLRASQQEDEEEEEQQQQQELSFSSSGMGMGESGLDDFSADEPQQRARREEASRRAAKHDELRRETRAVAERVAARIDLLMDTAAPFAAHRELLRLRANLALFVGDLHLPSRLLLDDDEGGGGPIEERMEGLSLRKGEGEGEGEDGLRARAETSEERQALARRKEEQRRARELFQKIVDGGGEVDGWVRKFMRMGEEEEEEEEEEEGEGEGEAGFDTW